MGYYPLRSNLLKESRNVRHNLDRDIDSDAARRDAEVEPQPKLGLWSKRRGRTSCFNTNRAAVNWPNLSDAAAGTGLDWTALRSVAK